MIGLLETLALLFLTGTGWALAVTWYQRARAAERYRDLYEDSQRALRQLRIAREQARVELDRALTELAALRRET